MCPTNVFRGRGEKTNYKPSYLGKGEGNAGESKCAIWLLFSLFSGHT